MRPLGRPRSGWDNIIKMDLKEVRGGMDWIDLAQYRDTWITLFNALLNFWVP
jgi:hypothetical protein